MANYHLFSRYAGGKPKARGVWFGGVFCITVWEKKHKMNSVSEAQNTKELHVFTQALRDKPEHHSILLCLNPTSLSQ
jgi:hypothetical protein